MSLLLSMLLFSFKIESEQFGYAARHLNRSWESRYHLGIADRSKPEASLQYGFSADLWGIVPQQTSDWLDIPEAFIGYNVSNVALQIGRILPAWAKNKFCGSLQEKIFPRFAIDPLTEFTDGIVGAYAVWGDNRWLIEFLYSPLFIPSRGGVKFENNSQGSPSLSRWLPPLFEKVKIGDGVIPLGYTLHLPALSDVLFEQGGFARISFNTERFNVAAIAARFFKPQAELKHDEKLHIQHETSVEARAHLYPEFPEERAVGLQSRLKFGSIDFFNEAAYFDRESTFRNSSGLEIKTDQRWFPSFTTAIQFSNSRSQTDAFIPSPPSNTWLSTVILHPLEISELFLSYETDFLMTQRILRGRLDLKPFSRMTTGVGFDMLSGDDKTYWGMFRSNDRLWVKASYVF